MVRLKNCRSITFRLIEPSLVRMRLSRHITLTLTSSMHAYQSSADEPSLGGPAAEPTEDEHPTPTEAYSLRSCNAALIIS